MPKAVRVQYTGRKPTPGSSMPDLIALPFPQWSASGRGTYALGKEEKPPKMSFPIIPPRSGIRHRGAYAHIFVALRRLLHDDIRKVKTATTGNVHKLQDGPSK